MKTCKSVIAMLAVTVLLMVVSGCKKEGPLERAGKKVDETVEKAGEQVEKAGKEIQKDVKGE